MEISSTAGKPIICKAAVCRAPGEALVMEDIEVAPPKAWEVRIKIMCTSLCHTDISFWKAPAPLGITPRIYGHEAVGTVESVGENVEEVKEGDLVLPVFFSECGDCRDCRSMKSNVCTKFLADRKKIAMPRDILRGRFKDVDGEPIHHFLSVSSFTEYTVVDVTHVVKINSQIPIDIACLLSCGVSTGIGAAWKVAEIEQGSTVAIFGLGTVGLAVAEGARWRGASKIIGVDVNQEKCDLGKKFGVTDFINPANYGLREISDVIHEMTDGGADYCFECIGLASLMHDAFQSSRRGSGKTIILGVELNNHPLILNSAELLPGKCIMGSLFGGVKPKSDIPTLAQKFLDKEIKLDGFITHEIGFSEINKAFDYFIEGKTLRCIIWMDKKITS